MKSSVQTGLLFAVLLAVGGVAWTIKLASRLEVDAQPLAALPQALGEWSSEEEPVEDGVAEMLRADYNLQRTYQHPLGEYIWLYVGYYGTTRGGRPEHTPWICYPSAGWTIESARETTVDAARGLRANELVVDSEGDRRLVLFWYRSERTTGITGGVGLSLAHLRDRLRDGRADGALVRVSTPLDDETAARSRLISFAAEIDQQLAAHWPIETR